MEVTKGVLNSGWKEGHRTEQETFLEMTRFQAFHLLGKSENVPGRQA